MNRYNAEDFVILSHDEAREEIARRWRNAALRQRVVDFLDGDLPEQFLREPRGVLGRHLGIPDTETRSFISISHNLGIKPLLLEFLDDKFVTINPDKLRLGRIDVCEKMNKNNEPIIRCTRIIDFTNSNNRYLKDVSTVWGEKLSDFFHDAFEPLGQEKPEMVDMSPWYSNNGGIAQKYYKKFYALFVAHAVLIDYYDEISKLLENPFFRDNEFTNYCATAEYFGVKPMIVQLFSREEVERCDQWYFDAKMQNILDQKMKKL